jgi:hypothetical protein
MKKYETKKFKNLKVQSSAVFELKQLQIHHKPWGLLWNYNLMQKEKWNSFINGYELRTSFRNWSHREITLHRKCLANKHMVK